MTVRLPVMKKFLLLILPLVLAGSPVLRAQPSFTGPMPSTAVVDDPNQRRAAYERRVNEVIAWYTAQAKPGVVYSRDVILAKLAQHEDAAECSRGVLEMMKEPGTGPFWMFPVVGISLLGQDQLSPEAKQAIRHMWRTTYQIRGDTENHWAMYYISLYLISEQYPNEPADSWYTGKSSSENLAESRAYLIHWMNLATTIGQGEYNPTGYIAEYAIPLMYLATWAKDPAMRLRGQMMLDLLFGELAENSLHGILHAPNARTDEGNVVERSTSITSYFNWLLFGNTVPNAGYGGWGMFFAVAAKNYQVPEVIYRIAVDRDRDFVERDLKRTRRRWRMSDQQMPPIYKTAYMRQDYAVGSYQGGVSDPIQTHVWDVIWDVPDPRGVHNTIYSLHPHSSNDVMQTYFSAYPEPMIPNLRVEGKPSYDSPDKVLGSSPYERVFQDLDTVIALYDIPAGTRFPQVNGFFSKDLADVTEDKSGWIFARGGRTFLAYRPLAGYRWIPYQHRNGGWAKDTVNVGGRILVSEHLQNGTIVQAASASEFASFDAFKAAINALPLAIELEPTPTVRFTTLRGKQVVFTYGATPVVDGHPLDYGAWKLFESPYLNAERGSGVITLTHGAFRRVLDFNAVKLTDTVVP